MTATCRDQPTQTISGPGCPHAGGGIMAPDPFKHSSRVPFFEIITTRFPGGIAAEGTVISGDRHVKAVRPHFAEGPNRCDAPVKGPENQPSGVQLSGLVALTASALTSIWTSSPTTRPPVSSA